MFDWIHSTFDTLAEYFIDLLIWLLEFVFWIFDTILRFVWELAKPIITGGFDAIAGFVPGGLIDGIVASYSWLQYINEWVPIKFCIALFIAYYGIAVALFAVRTVLAFLPWGGRKL